MRSPRRPIIARTVLLGGIAALSLAACSQKDGDEKAADTPEIVADASLAPLKPELVTKVTTAGTMTAPSVIVAVELIIFALFQLGRGRFAASTILHARFFLHRIRRGDGGLLDWVGRLVDDIREDE